MIIDYRSGLRGVLVDASTGKRIPFGTWANLDTGEWKAWAATHDGKRVAFPKREVSGRCPLRFVESYAPQVPARPALPDGAGDRAQGEALRQQYRRTTDRILIVRGVGCEQPGCGRPAAYRVADELLLEPETDAAGRQHERAMTVASHRYCARHYRAPRQLAPNGDTVCRVEVPVQPGW